MSAVSVTRGLQGAATGADFLLKTKLFIPPVRAGLVPRTRLLGRIDEGLKRRLTVISAPPGFGKTTLLSDWAQRHQPFACWVQLDAGDNDPARFLAYLIGAFGAIRPGAGRAALTLLRAPQPPPFEPVLAALINDLTAVQDDFALILDDYHTIHMPSVHQVMTYLIDHLPPRMHVMIASRAVPPLPLARLRAQGQLVELRAADLRFTLNEAAAFLERSMGLPLSLADVAALQDRTEGWITGLQLAGLSLQGNADVSGFIAAFAGSNQYVLDYLLEEVFSRQPERVQNFLLHTSVLERLCGPLCDALLGDPERRDPDAPAPAHASGVTGISPPDNGQQMLAYLDRANLFTFPLDVNRQWYRYHHLFADFLRARLEQTQPQLVPELHRRAAGWYEAQADETGDDGMLAGAVRHLLAMGNYECAAELIEEIFKPVMLRGQVTTVLNWLDSLPASLLNERTSLYLSRALALLFAGGFGGEMHAIEPRLNELEAALARGGDSESSREQDAALRGQLAALRATIARLHGRIPEAIALSRSALNLLRADDVLWRGLIALNLAHAYWLNADPRAASGVYAEAVSLSAEPGNVLTLFATCNLIDMHIIQGHLHEAERLCRQVLQAAARAASSETQLLATCLVYMSVAELAYHWNNLEACAGYALESIELSKQPAELARAVAGYLMLAQVRAAQGNITSAHALLSEAEPLGMRMNAFHFKPLFASVRARLWIAEGKLDAAARWAAEAGLSPTDPPNFERETDQIQLARLLVAQGRHEQAVAFLERLLASAEAGGRTGRVIEILAVQASAHGRMGQREQAIAVLERALALARPEGYIRLFLDEGPALAEAFRWVHDRLAGASAGAEMAVYVARLLDAFEHASLGAAGRDPGSSRQAALMSRVPGLRANVQTAPPRAKTLHLDLPGLPAENEPPGMFPGAAAPQAAAAEPVPRALAEPEHEPRAAPISLPEPLTPRELEILALIAAGLTNREIAERLVITVGTAKWHINQLYTKLGIGSRTQALARARELGIL